jgi:hypothetical protein
MPDFTDWTPDQITNWFNASQDSAQATRDLTKSEGKASRKSAQKIASSNNAASRANARLQAQTQTRIQAMSDESSMARLQAELASRLGIQNTQDAAAMARLEKDLGVRQADIDARLSIARDELGFKREELAANVQVERDKLAQAKDEMEKIGIPKMLADKWYQEQQVRLADSAQKIEEEKVGVQRGQLGLDAFSKAVDLASSPAKYFQFGDFAQGLAANPQATDWLKALGSETAQSGFGPSTDVAASLPGVGISPQQAMGTMLSLLGANRTTAADQAAGAPAQINPALQAMLNQQQQELGQIGQVARAGGSALAPGTLERMQANDPDTLAKFQSGLGKLRFSVPDWMRSYSRAGVYNASPDQLVA